MPPQLVKPLVDAHPNLRGLPLARLIAKQLRTSQAASYEHIRNLRTIGELPADAHESRTVEADAPPDYSAA
jgi:hypothetical protein